MASGEYPFIDIASLDRVREKFALGASLIVVSTDLETIIWTNGTGAALIGHDDVESAIGASPGFGDLARRQIAALPNFPSLRENTTVALRFDRRLKSQVVVMQASPLILPDGESAIMLAADPAASARTRKARAKSAIGGFTQSGHHAAYLDNDARIVACTDDFHSLGLSNDVLANLVNEVAGEADRIIKRLVPIAGGQAPAGIVRLTDDPADHLLVVVADADALEAYGQQARHDISGGTRSTELLPEAEIQPKESSLNPAPEQRDAGQLPAMETPNSPAVQEPDGEPSSWTPHEAKTTPAPQDLRTTDHDKTNINAKRPVRFVWKTDIDARIIEISEEFVAAVGEKTGAVKGRTFSEVAADLGLDLDGAIAALLKRRDTWSGRSVSWPISHTGLQVPVDLAALPVYDRDRAFQGFRGFGVARMTEMQPDPAERGKSFEGFGVTAARPASETRSDKSPEEPEKAEAVKPFGKRRPAVAANDDPFHGEVPAISIGKTSSRRASDTIIDLEQKRRAGSDAFAEKIVKSGLSDTERSAFQQIADRLRRETEDVPPAAPVAFGKRKNPIVSPEETEAHNPAPADDSVPVNLESNRLAVPLHEEPVRDAPEAAGHAAPALRPNPVPSAFSGIWRLFRTQMADHGVLMQLPVPVMVYNERGIVFANSALLSLTGYQDIETLNREGGMDALFPQHTGPQDYEGESLLSVHDREGREIPIEAHLNSVSWEGEKSLALSMRVSGGEHTAEANTASAEDKLRAHIDELVSILDTATDGVVTISPDLTIRSLNRSAEALFGYESDDIVGRPFVDLFAMESRQIAGDYVSGLSGDGVASLLNDGREVIGRESHGRFIPLFMTVGKLAGSAGYCAVLRDITHWKQAESELTEARRLAEKSSSQKSEFLARISHEIRTPLNAIIGFSELMLDEKFGPVGNDRYRDYLKDINRSGNHVLDLVNDLLDISKIEAGEMELDYEAVHLNDALAEAIAMMQPQANRERVIVRSSLASNLPDVVADLRSVRQIALNLLSNAIRYTLAGGQVIVSTTYDADGSVALRVRDTGVGMSQSEISQALKPFRQISALKRKHDRGTGLGLPLTKAMVEANRANFSITSTPGEGTLVEIMFPPTRVLAD